MMINDQCWRIMGDIMMNDDDRSYDVSMLSPWWIHNESWMTMKDTTQDDPWGNHCLLKVGAIGSHDGLQSRYNASFESTETAAASILSTAADIIAQINDE